MRFLWLFPLATLAALFAAPHATAQISVAPVRDLNFGPVISGLPTYIGPSHPTRSGQFQVITPPLARVQVRFTLPSQLDGPAGATMPINFANNDALHVDGGVDGVPSTFNPKATRNFQVTSGTAFVFLGGTVSPATAQAPGTYTGTVTLTINIQ